MKSHTIHGLILLIGFIIDNRLLPKVHAAEIVCLNCIGVPYPRDCYRTIRCTSNEECYLEQVVTESGNIVYNLGCQSTTNCAKITPGGRRSISSIHPRHVPIGNNTITTNGIEENVDSVFIDIFEKQDGRQNGGDTGINKEETKEESGNEGAKQEGEEEDAPTGDIVTCAMCCNNGFHCNRELCGQTSGAIGNQEYCADCSDVLHPNQCEYIALCNVNDVCYTEFINLNGEDRYRLGCIPSTHCSIITPTQSTVLVGRRDFPETKGVGRQSSESDDLEIGIRRKFPETDDIGLGRRRQTSDTDLLGLVEYCNQCCTDGVGGCNTEICGTSGTSPTGMTVLELVDPPERTDFCVDAYIAACSVVIPQHPEYCLEPRYKHYACRETCKTCDNPAHNTDSPPVTTVSTVSSSLHQTDCFYDSTRYMGEHSTTFSGKSCVTWSDIDPFMQGMPDGNVAQVGNRCRDPDGTGHPWCYTTRNAEEFEFCPVPYCKECYFSAINTWEYQGFVRNDVNGKKCDPWLDAQRAQPTLLDSMFIDGSASAAGSYCRDPLRGGNLRCYSGGSLLVCDITECPGPCADDPDTDCALIKPIVCSVEYLSATLCPKTCNKCGFGLLPAVAKGPPEDLCIDNAEARCSSIASYLCSNIQDAVRLCPKTCKLCYLLHNNTHATPMPTTTPTTTTPRPTTVTIPTTTVGHWLQWSAWNCTYSSGGNCFQVRYRDCSTSVNSQTVCPGDHYNVYPFCQISDCPDLVTTQAPVVTTTQDPCHDDPLASCDDAKILELVCAEPTSSAQLCPKSCGLCGTCYDYLDCSAPVAQSLFCQSDSYAKQYCRKTCSKCNETQVAVVSNECGDPIKDVAICVSLHRDICICDDPDIRDLCRYYCQGSCPNHPRNDTNTGCVPTKRRRDIILP